MTVRPLSVQMQSAYEAFTLARIDAWTDKVAVLESRIAELEAELKEHDGYYRKVVNDECASDEVHCTCVPALRDKIDSLEAEVTSFRCGLRGHT